MISLKRITKLYGQLAAVRDLDLEVEDGEIMGIIGHNGAGKTTILKMIVGLISPTSGTIEVMGRDVAKESTYVKQFIGYLPEESPLYENMAVAEHLMFFSELYKVPKRKAKERIDLLLGSLKLPEQDKLTGELSKGMKRKVAIARALLHDPKILILDEPNAGLDPLTSFFIINYLKSLKDQGKTILLSAHNLFHVEYICDRVAILKNGQVVICDSMEAIRKTLGRREYEVVFKSDDKLDVSSQSVGVSLSVKSLSAKIRGSVNYLHTREAGRSPQGYFHLLARGGDEIQTGSQHINSLRRGKPRCS